ncbi:AbrB/MazE/SpoVT family DNA-binding domain-containing protein [Pseudalkalibacillus hwajinpoensis]|uniref:AbrB/MazE/SpoVT family DNA-binding domain-containing protein n=1 Tax=Guptibacillus hwajinpoensis TaxID=208199 RepID=UPI00325BED2E
MKSTGVVRKIDELGRIVIPKELRRTLDIQVKDPIEIFISENKVILQKYQADMACMITGDVLDENMTFGNGSIVLSPAGMAILQEELESKSGLKHQEMLKAK